MLEPQADLLERALQVLHRPRRVHPAVDEHDPVAGGDRPGVAVGHARQRERQPQTPHAGHDALSPPDLGPPRRLPHRADGNVPRMASDARQVAETYFAALARRDPDAAAACWAPDGVDNLIDQTVAEGPAGVRAFFGELFAAVPDFAPRGRDDRRGGRPRGGPLARVGHVRRRVLVPGHRPHRRPHHAHRARPHRGPRRADRAQRRVQRRPRPRAPDRHAAGAGLARGRRDDAGVQREVERRTAAGRRRRRAGGGRRLARARRRAARDERLPDRGRRRRRDRVRRGRAQHGQARSPRRARASAGSTASCWATATSTTAAPPAGSARRSTAIRTSARTPRATPDGTTCDLSRLAPHARRGLPAAAADVGRRAGRDRRDDRGGRGRQRLPRRAPARPRAGHDRAVPGARRRRAHHRRLLHARHRRPASTARRASRTRRSTRTPSRRARRSASSPACGRARPGPVTPSRSRGDVAAQLERAATS